MKNNQLNKKDKLKKLLLKNAFPLFGFGALVWFLIRVIPKPSRAGYPCMKVAAPLASSFVLWILGLSATVFSVTMMKKAFVEASPRRISLFLILTFISFTFTLNQSSITSFAFGETGFEETVTPNNPIGEAKGINPGRVVWVWNPDATNENCTNQYFGESQTPADEDDDGWFLNKNNDQDVIDNMFSDGLRNLTGASDDKSAWDQIFTHFNEQKTSVANDYTEGEKIFIKINATSTWGKGSPWGNITNNNEHMQNNYYGMAETSPQLILSLLRQLVNVKGIPQENISIGDPMKHIYNNSYNIWYGEFPNVNYMANEGGNGRVAVTATSSAIINYSDNGNEMPAAIGDKIYQVMYNADYLINVPTLKAHARAGITLFAKNHFGSHIRGSAEHLHPGLVAEHNAQPTRLDSNMYRVQVDLMGHEKFGGNQLLFLLDALYAGSEAVDPPTKWEMAPFNSDWTSSIFLSQDPVAIESVAFDFLYTEYDGSYDKNYRQKVNYPHMTGTTDYLRQAASSEYWPEGIVYDPENDGTPIGSLGVNEHWNNPIDKKYSRNLGTGNGIELLFISNKNQAVSAPSSLSAVVLNGTDVELSWTDNSDNEDGFIIERRIAEINEQYIVMDTVLANGTKYTDTSIKTHSSYIYKVLAYNSSGQSDYSAEIMVEGITVVGINENVVENKFQLNQNYPNPFNPTTSISFSIKSKSNVKLEIFDITGKLINTLFDGYKNAGQHSVMWNGLNNKNEKVSSGTYIYTLTTFGEAKSTIQSKKMILIK